jgi:hypothetical protein
MPAKIELKVGERIPLAKGGLSDLVYLGDTQETQGGHRVCGLRCSCGEEFFGTIAKVRKKDLTKCPKCRRNIELIEGEGVPLIRGGVSPLVFVKRELSKKHNSGSASAVITARCVCGNEFTCLLASIRCGATTQCAKCKAHGMGLEATIKHVIFFAFIYVISS